MFKKRKHILYLTLIVIVFSCATFVVLKFSRYKLYKCLRNSDKERREAVLKAHNRGDLSNQKIISIEQAADKKRDECYVLFAK